MLKLFENKDCISHSLLANALVLSRRCPWHLRGTFAVALFSSGFRQAQDFSLHVLTALTQTLRPDAEPWTPLCPPPPWVWEPQIGFGRKSNGICHSRLLVVPFSFEFECNMKLASRHFCTHFTDEKCETQQY